jgi:hypothetical protein
MSRKITDFDEIRIDRGIRQSGGMDFDEVVSATFKMEQNQTTPGRAPAFRKDRTPA